MPAHLGTPIECPASAANDPGPGVRAGTRQRYPDRVHPQSTVHALFQGGPADGAVRPVECEPDGRPPKLLMLGGGGKLFVGSSDQPAAPEHPMYELEPEAEPTASMWPYQYVETLTAG